MVDSTFVENLWKLDSKPSPRFLKYLQKLIIKKCDRAKNTPAVFLTYYLNEVITWQTNVFQICFCIHIKTLGYYRDIFWCPILLRNSSRIYKRYISHLLFLPNFWKFRFRTTQLRHWVPNFLSKLQAPKFCWKKCVQKNKRKFAIRKFLKFFTHFQTITRY